MNKVVKWTINIVGIPFILLGIIVSVIWLIWDLTLGITIEFSKNMHKEFLLFINDKIRFE